MELAVPMPQHGQTAAADYTEVEPRVVTITKVCVVVQAEQLE